jgi:hypothetical protein
VEIESLRVSWLHGGQILEGLYVMGSKWLSIDQVSSTRREFEGDLVGVLKFKDSISNSNACFSNFQRASCS